MISSPLALDADGNPYFDADQSTVYLYGDTDGNPYFDPDPPGTSKVSVDADGEPYFGDSVSAAPSFSGRTSLRFVAGNDASETSLMFDGPSGSMPFAPLHKGAFAIAQDSGQPTITIQFQITSADAAWVEVWAQWYLDEGSTLEPQFQDLLVSRTSVGEARDDDDYLWTQVDYHAPAAQSVTHWKPVLRFYSDSSGSVLTPGAEVFVDDLYVPDNGLSLEDQPYLDGNQPYGVWEGDPNASTSVFGYKDVEAFLGDNLIAQGGDANV